MLSMGQTGQNLEVLLILTLNSQGILCLQVSLFNSRGVELCSGVMLGRFSVLTAARCLFLDSGSNLPAYNFYVVPGNKL